MGSEQGAWHQCLNVTLCRQRPGLKVTMYATRNGLHAVRLYIIYTYILYIQYSSIYTFTACARQRMRNEHNELAFIWFTYLYVDNMNRWLEHGHFISAYMDTNRKNIYISACIVHDNFSSSKFYCYVHIKEHRNVLPISWKTKSSNKTLNWYIIHECFIE